MPNGNYMQIGETQFTRCPVREFAPEDELMVVRWSRGLATSGTPLEQELWPASVVAALEFLDGLKAEETADG